MALSAEEVTLYSQRLTEAEGALHLLNIGQAARTYVDQNGERVEYTVANRGALRTYIMELKALLGKTTVTGPMTVGML